MPDFTFDRQWIWEVCKECAVTLANTPLNIEYNNRVARLLFFTAVQESELQWERQRSPDWASSIGGFSKWQLEQGSILDSLNMLKRPDNATLARRVRNFLFKDPHASIHHLSNTSIDTICFAMRLDDNDKIGCCFARLHYMRVALPIPAPVTDMAKYYKQYYNTPLGAATVEQFLRSAMKYSSEMDLTLHA
jgi:hypothetical protein